MSTIGSGYLANVYNKTYANDEFPLLNLTNQLAATLSWQYRNGEYLFAK